MAVLVDPVILGQYTTALSRWNFTNYILWKRVPREWVQQNLDGITPELIGKLMYEHVREGGEIHQIVEKRPQWLEWPFHYDLYVMVGKREVYLETVLCDDDPSDCTIIVVSAHDP